MKNIIYSQNHKKVNVHTKHFSVKQNGLNRFIDSNHVNWINQVYVQIQFHMSQAEQPGPIRILSGLCGVACIFNKKNPA